MANILYRESTTPTTPGSTTAKGTPLTNLEVDGNLKSINDGLATKASLVANTFTGAQNLAYGTVASHATAADIWGAAGNTISWTGTATTTGFPSAPQAGSERILICAGLSSFTAGANMLIDGIASGNTFACAVNDRITVTAVSATQFRLSIDKYDGTAIVGGATGSLIYLSTVTASASATVDIETTFDSTYDEYMIAATGVVIASDNISLYLRMKIGGSYLTTATYEHHLASPNSLANAYNGQGLEAQTEIRLSPNNSNARPANFRIWVHHPSSTTLPKAVEWQGSSHHATAPTLHSITGAGGNTGTGALTGIQILAASGNITSGTFRLYGIKKS